MDNSEKCWSVYRHNCPDGRCYIGITSNKPETRWSGGLGYEYGNREFFIYILSVGWRNIGHEILYSGLSEEEAREIEKQEIKSAGARAFNYVHADKEIRAIPEEKPKDYGLTQMEREAVEIWCKLVFGVVNDDTLWKTIHKYRSGWERTVLEFSSGDEKRIEKEKHYLSEVAPKIIGKAE